MSQQRAYRAPIVLRWKRHASKSLIPLELLDTPSWVLQDRIAGLDADPLHSDEDHLEIVIVDLIAPNV